VVPVQSAGGAVPVGIAAVFGAIVVTYPVLLVLALRP
jgi:hypothetical protein